jgi:ParB family protein of integrating conjugative element (PFGI_1 class)
MKKLSLEAITEKLHQAPFPRGPQLDRLSDPIIETPMQVTLEQLRPYEHNPRFIRNPLYEDIKASIRERGLDQPPPITRRPGETSFIIRNGGNTRLAILGELWQETHDPRFFRIHCLFKPWTNEITALLGHLTESDLHGQLTFIERALAVAKLKTMLEPVGAELSQRQLARALGAEGYPISQSHISRMFDTLEHLLPAIPQTLYAGLGKPQIERLIGLRSQAQRTWNRYPTVTLPFNDLWLETLADFDADAELFDLERIQDELLERMSRSLGQSYRLLALELSDTRRVIPTPVAADAPPQDHRPAPRVDEALPDHTVVAPTADSTPALPQTRTDSEQSLVPAETRTVTADGPASWVSPRGGLIDRDLATETSPVDNASIAEIWIIAPTLDSPERLRVTIAGLAHEMATYAGCPESVIDQPHGLGFALSLERSNQPSPRATGIHLLLLALLRAHDEVDFEDRKQLPAALFGQLLLGVYQLPLGDRPAMDIGLERLPDLQLIQLFRLIRLARRLVDLTLNPDPPKALL